MLPPKAGNYAALYAVKGKLLYSRRPRTGSGTEKSPILFFDFDEREEKTILDDADGFEPTADGKKIFAVQKRKFAVVEVKADQKFEKPLRTAEMEAPVDPRAEWRQIFNDTWRFERDYFYDPGMHGVDWAAMRTQYGRLIDDAVTRWDVNFVIGELIGELNSSHTYRGGGDEEDSAHRGIGMLGVDWELANGAYRIKRIVRGGPWDADVRSPLLEPGVSVSEGDYVLAVNGTPLDVSRDPWAGFDGLANKPAWLTVNSRPTMEGSRQVLVKCLDDEVELRFRAWIEERRRRVDEATGGKAGYIYVQSTGTEAQNELVRQFVAQRTKDALVIDERFNSGGQIPDRFIELLNRPILSYWGVRDGASQQWPPVAHRGPKVMLINGWSGSGGDAFPFYFREAQLGPLIGTRTWGGLIGISRIARSDRRRRRHGADVPHVRSQGPVVCRRPRSRSRHPCGRRSCRAGQGDRCPTRTGDRRSDVPAEVNDPGAVEASLRASRALVAVGSGQQSSGPRKDTVWTDVNSSSARLRPPPFFRSRALRARRASRRRAASN